MEGCALQWHSPLCKNYQLF